MAEISCKNCIAACCKGPETIELTADEAAQMEKAGTVLHPLAEPVEYDRDDVLYPMGINAEKGTIIVADGHEYQPLEAGLGRYILLGACGNLVTGTDGWQQCGIYEDRPAACRDFEEGGHKCGLMRMGAGVDRPDEEFKERLRLLNS